MKAKPFDRFFVFVLALSAALYFFGARPYPGQVLQDGAESVSLHITKPDKADGASPSSGGSEADKEQGSEDEGPAGSDESPEELTRDESEAEVRTSAVNVQRLVSSQRTFHCLLRVRPRSGFI